MDASLWDISKESKITRNFDKYRRTMLPDEVLSQTD